MIVEFVVDEPWESSGSRMTVAVTNMETDRVWTVTLRTPSEEEVPVLGSLRPRHSGESLVGIAKGLEVQSNLVLTHEGDGAESTMFVGRARLLS
jgi:hypothetical protein